MIILSNVDLRVWLRAAFIRAIKTLAQTAVAMITIGNMLWELNWVAICGISMTAAVYSLLTSLAGLPETN